jgi:hypothetical protein
MPRYAVSNHTAIYFFDRASIDWLGVVLRKICKFKISVPQSRFGHKYYTQSNVFVSSFKISRKSAACKTCVNVDAYWMLTSDKCMVVFYHISESGLEKYVMFVLIRHFCTWHHRYFRFKSHGYYFRISIIQKQCSTAAYCRHRVVHERTICTVCHIA